LNFDRIKAFVRAHWQKRWLRRVFYCFTFFLLLFLFRYPILRGLGNWLISEDDPQKVELVVVLGGSSFDRATKAAELYRKGYATQFITTGQHVSGALEVLELDYTEADLSKIQMVKEGVPEANIYALEAGTSTREEADLLLNYCIENNIASIAIVSDKFHLRRVRYSFSDDFEEANIAFYCIGAKSSQYDESRWWQAERGLLMVSREYMKLVYYMIS